MRCIQLETAVRAPEQWCWWCIDATLISTHNSRRGDSGTLESISGSEAHRHVGRAHEDTALPCCASATPVKARREIKGRGATSWDERSCQARIASTGKSPAYIRGSGAGKWESSARGSFWWRATLRGTGCAGHGSSIKDPLHFSLGPPRRVVECAAHYSRYISALREPQKEDTMRSRLVGWCGVRIAAAVSMSVIVAVHAAAAATRTQVFIPTSIHYPGSTTTSARGINNDGDIVGTFFCAVACTNPRTGETSTRGTHGFLLRGGVYTRLDVPGGVATIPRGISQQGIVVGHYAAGGVTHGFMYSNGQYIYPIDVPAHLFDNPGSPARHTLPVRMSPQGDLVGCIHEANLIMTTMRGWLLRNGEFTILATPHFAGDPSRDPDTMNNGVSATGAIVGFYFSDGVSYIADESGIVQRFTIDERFTLAWDINARGDIVGVVGENMAMTAGSPVSPRGFVLRRNGSAVVLEAQGATNTQAIGINDHGDIVGQYTDATGTHGFVYRLDRSGR